MCSVINVRQIEECIDGTTIKEFELDSPMCEDTMRRIAAEGRLAYYPNFPRPYFRIDRRNAYIIQGVLGLNTFRVVFSQSVTNGLEDFIQFQVEKGETHGCQTCAVL